MKGLNIMTEPNIQYSIPSSLPVASPPTYLLLIDSRVSNYQEIVNAKQPGVHHIVFDVPTRPTHSAILIKNIENKIADLGIAAFTSIGLVQHNDGQPFYEMFGSTSDLVKPRIHNVESTDPDFQSWNSISIFITKLRRNYGIENFDMMACALYSNPDWKYIIDKLTLLTGVTVRASTDDTGAASLGGDWFLESHIGVNLKSVYFTDAIEAYNGILVSTTGDSSGVPWSSTAKKLILIDHTIPDIHVIINAMNDDTYCLVFNSQYDTHDTILSKLRFLSGNNRYILDAFYYPDALLVDGSSSSSSVVTPEMLQNEANWPFYPESTCISIQNPVFFQRARENPDVSGGGEVISSTPNCPPVPEISRYIPRDKIRITDLDQIYEIGKTHGEVEEGIIQQFECVGIIQHSPETTLGYRLTNMTPHATIDNVSSVDPNLSSWSHYGAFIERLKSVHHMETLDLMACALYANPDWKYIIDHLATQHAITIRASLDNTGTTNDGGNWILETAEINLTSVYFTNAIHQWDHLLPTSLTSLRFDGVDDAVNMGVPAWSYSTQFRSTMTIECWFKTTDTSNQKSTGQFVSRWFSGGYASHSMFLLGMNPDGTVTCWITNTSSNFALTTTSAAYKDTLWHHVAVTYNSSTGVLSMYIDGVFTNNSTNSAYPTTSSFGLLSSSTLMRLILGSDDAGTSPNVQNDRQFRGSLSDVRIWNVVRSAAEIAANYRVRLIGNETGLVGYWKLHQGNGTGWGSYSVAMDSTTNRTNGTLVGMGATPSGSWVTTTDLSFNARISTLTLGANNGVYSISDVSFSFIDPTSNSLGTFSYAVSPSSIATVSNGAATTKTIYATSGAISIPTLSLFEFPEIASLASWQIDISFTVTGGAGTWRGLIGDMYNSVNSRGWGLWISSSNRIHWSWMAATSEPATISVNLNTAYVLTASQSSGTITLTLRTVSTGATQTGSFSNGANVIGKGPVTIGGWQNTTSENFPGTISYVNVSVPTNQRVVTLTSGTTGTPATVTATQDSFLDFSSGTKTASLTVTKIAPTIGTLTVPTKNFRDLSFNITKPTSNSTGLFSYTSSNTNVATVTKITFTTTSLLARYDATQTSNYTLSGNTVSQWNDLTGNGYHLASNGTGPTLTSINSVTAFDFNSGRGLIRTSVPLSSAITIFMVIKYSTNIGNWGSFMHHGHRDTDWAFERNSWNNAMTTHNIQFQSNNVNGPPELSTTNNTNYILIGRISGSTREFWRYSDTQALGFSTGTGVSIVTGNKSIYVGKSENNESSNSTIGEILYYNSALSNADVSANLSYLQNKWFNNLDTPSFITIIGAGTSTITATQDATNYYNSGSVSGTFNVNSIAPTFGAFTIPSAKNFRDAAFSLGAPTTDSSGVFQYSSSNLSAATVSSNGLVTIVGAGSTVLTVTQDACGNFTSRDISGALVVSPIAPTFGAFTIDEKKITDISFTLTAPTSDSSGIFRFSTDTSGSVIATVTSDGIVTLTGVEGTAVITATQDASGNYTGGSSVTSLLIVTAELSNFTVPSDKVYGDSTFDLTNPTTIYSGEPFIFISSDTTVASIGGANGRTVTIHKAGSTTITAKQEATGSHGELSITAVLVIAKKTTVITLSAITKNYGDASFNLSPTSNNTDVSPDVFTFTSRNTNIISIFDVSYAAIRGVDSVIIDIIQEETTNFSTGTATVTITVNKGTPILSAFTVSSSRTYGSAPFSALEYPTSMSNGTITYSSSDTNVATIDNSGIITLVGSGYVNFTASQASTAYYNATTKTTNTMTVHRQLLPLTRVLPDSSSNINKIYGDSYFTVSAINASNGGTITYETDTPSVAGVINALTGVISVVSVGTATITARREQTAQYTSLPVSWTVEVARATTTLTGLTDLSYNVTAAPFTVAASSASDGAVTYSLQDPSSVVLTIHPTTGLVTLRSPGSAVIVASQAQGTLYLAPSSITATITVSSAGNALQGATLTNTSSFANVDLSGASLSGAVITTNTVFTEAKLSNANLTNAVITSANFTSANLSGASLTGATITGATFTSASLQKADLSGATLTNTVFAGSDLSGAKLTGVDASGASFANAKLNNVDMTGANVENVNFTNTSIKGAIITDISFSPLQKLQLLKNSDNRDIGEIIIPAVSGTTILAAISETSPLRAIADLDLTSASVSVSVVIPTTSVSPTAVLPDVVLNVSDNDKFYLPINEGEYFQVEGVKYYTTNGVVRNYTTNSVVEVIQYGGVPVWLIAGSIVGLVLQANTLNTSSFVVPNNMIFTNLTPFMPTTLPTSNSDSPIVYSSTNTNVATIDPSSGMITLTGNIGYVKFNATQVKTSTYEAGSKSSNYMYVGMNINFSLIGLNQSIDLSTLATLDSSSVNMDATDATSVFYIKVSDFNNIFKYQTDSFDINDISSSDVKYYVFHRKWPTDLKINPSHAMMDKTESINMLGFEQGYTSDKSLLKHDFIRYIALRLFNTIHGVDLFSNESDLQENTVYLGETVRNNIDVILSGISTTSSSESMSYDASGNKYLTNDASGNTNLCRELMRQIAAAAPDRFYNNGGNDSLLKNVPLLENDTIKFKLIIRAAVGQNILTGVNEIPSRSYTIKLILKNTVNTNANTNTTVSDSEMYPNSYPYSTSVTTNAPTVDSSGVYNVYSPPAPIPFSRFGYNGWYYTNTTTWVNVAPTVRNHVKWIVPSNSLGTSTVADLQYIRLNLKIHNNASLPYLMIYTQAGSMRKYAVSGGNGSLTNGTVYSFYMNFNTYSREPAMIGYTNAALIYTIGSGTFANNEVITSIAVETDGNAAAGNVEFTLASVVVGELSTTSGVTTEKEHGFEASVPDAYP